MISETDLMIYANGWDKANKNATLNDFINNSKKRIKSSDDALSRVRESNDLIHWIKFFLNGVITTAEKGKKTFQKILKLKDNIDNKIITLGKKAKNAKRLIYILYKKPIINVNNVITSINVSKRTARELINKLIEMNILREVTGYKRNRVFEFNEYIKLF